MAGQVTLDDVARLSGVSPATASRALNGRPGVRDESRERVRRVAESLGFRPNRAARQLASGRSSVIGLILPTGDHVDAYGAAILHAVGRAAAAADQGLMLHLAAREPARAVQHVLRDGLVDGVLVSSIGIGTRWIDELLAADLPTVLIGSHPFRDDVDAVDVENLESSAAAVGHLFEQGCERVGLIAGPQDRADARARLAGYRLAHERADRRVDETLVVGGDFTRDSGRRCGDLLACRDVDGVFASNDDMARGAMWAFSQRGLRVPEDVALVGFDGTAIDELVAPTLTSVCQPFDEIAQMAVSELLTVIGGGRRSGAVLVAPELRVGGTSIRRPGAETPG